MRPIPLWKLITVTLVCILGIYYALPSFFYAGDDKPVPAWMPDQKVNLGLDLKGGAHLLLEIDYKTFLTEHLDAMSDDVKSRLRKADIGYKDVRVTPEHTIALTLTDAKDRSKALPLIREANPDLQIGGDGMQLALTLSETAMADRKTKLAEQSIEIIRRRVDETGTKEPIIQRQGDNRVLLQVPGVENPDHLKNLIGRTAKMTFHLVDSTVMDEGQARAPAGSMLLESEEKSPDGEAYKYAVKRRVMLSGDSLVDAHATFEQGRPVVAFRFDAIGSRKFGEVTRDNVGKPFAIVLDNKVISAPVIREPILGGSGIISGNFDVQSANDLALLLRAGALPAPLKVIEERTVGPSVGADSIAAGKLASMLSLALVAGFMILFYSVFGVFSCLALALNMVLIVAILALLQATLTLPGIAGIVLTIGMAVDANVLIYERMKEEFRNGRTAMSAAEAGFDRAFTTIFDSNLTTLIAAFLLYFVGTGTVKGFAVTLAIGILASMFTAVLCNRILVVAWMRRFRPKTLPI